MKPQLSMPNSAVNRLPIKAHLRRCPQRPLPATCLSARLSRTSAGALHLDLYGQPVKNIIFDWSGTLFDDFRFSFHSTQHILTKFGGPKITVTEYRQNFELPVWKFYRRYLPKTISLDQLHDEYFKHFSGYAVKARLFPQVKFLFQFLHRQKINIHLCSTVEQSLLEGLVYKHGLSFSSIYGSVRDKSASLKGMLNNERLKAGETIFIGDMEHDLNAAHKNHLRAGAMLCGYRDVNQLATAKPDFIWQDHQAILLFLQNQFTKPKSPMKKWPLATVGALVNCGPEIFLVQTHKWKHSFGIPGGKIDWGETMESAVSRELLEETGLSLKQVKLALIQDSINSREFYRENSHFLLVNFFATTRSKKFKLNDEAESGFWIKPEAALQLNLNQPTRVLIENYLKNH